MSAGLYVWVLDFRKFTLAPYSYNRQSQSTGMITRLKMSGHRRLPVSSVRIYFRRYISTERSSTACVIYSRFNTFPPARLSTRCPTSPQSTFHSRQDGFPALRIFIITVLHLAFLVSSLNMDRRTRASMEALRTRPLTPRFCQKICSIKISGTWT